MTGKTSMAVLAFASLATETQSIKMFSGGSPKPKLDKTVQGEVLKDMIRLFVKDMAEPQGHDDSSQVEKDRQDILTGLKKIQWALNLENRQAKKSDVDDVLKLFQDYRTKLTKRQTNVKNLLASKEDLKENVSSENSQDLSNEGSQENLFKDLDNEEPKENLSNESLKERLVKWQKSFKKIQSEWGEDITDGTTGFLIITVLIFCFVQRIY